jgi:gamma-glutamylcyclotransferase
LTIRVFAYGSNLCLERMAERAPSARVVAVGELAGHSLRWHKRGRDGSGKCDAFANGDPREVVHGVVYEMNDSDKAALDRVEGLGVHYFEKPVTIQRAEGGFLDAVTYVANPLRIDAALLPTREYKAWVTTGARQHHLPPAWIATLDAIPTLDET